MRDAFKRPLTDLRISVTDRCNMRCVYCMPRHVFGPNYRFLSRADILSFEEIERVTRVLVLLGVRKLRLTGGEPLVRRDIERLVSRLAGIEGVDDLSMTTNGVLLPAKARALRDAGLQRVTISLDALDDQTFRRMNDADVAVERVLKAIDAAAAAGLSPVKINAVVKRGLNDDQVVELAARFRHTGVIVRFIEYMDVGTTNGWRRDHVVSAAEIVERIGAAWPLEPVARATASEVARRFRYQDGGGEIGVIASVTQPFCGACSRLRLSAAGQLYTCLFAGEGHDLRSIVRSGASDAVLRERIERIWQQRKDRYSEERAQESQEQPQAPARVEMSHIGG